MKKLLVSLSIALGLLVPTMALPGSAMATNVFQVCGGNASSTDVCQSTKSKGNPFTNTLKVVIRLLSFAVGIAATLGLVIGGIKYITSQGDASSTKNARDTIIYSLVGLAIAAVAQALVAFVLNKL